MLTTPIAMRRARRGEQEPDPERDRDRPERVGAGRPDEHGDPARETPGRAAPRDFRVDRAGRPGDRPAEQESGREQGGEGGGHVRRRRTGGGLNVNLRVARGLDLC